MAQLQWGFGMMESAGFTYRAFISYSHRDKAWADWLHHSLETYRVPSRLVGARTAHGTIPQRLHPIFRDREELASADDLGRKVNEALSQSGNLVVLCSPASAVSRWVNAEVLAYKRLGRGERIFCLIVEGEPNASDLPGRNAEECFCPALRFQLDANGQLTGERSEPIAADARPGKDGRQNAKLKLIAGMLDVGFDALKHREQRRQMRRMAAVTTLALGVMAVTIVLAVLALVSRHRALIAQREAVVAQQTAERRQAQTEDILGFMLGDLRKKLATVGRLDLMNAVDDKATAYFDSLEPRDLDEHALEEQARLLTGIGQVRLDEGDADKAMVAFRDAYARSSELYRRQPGNGQRLFDMAQAEYWIGFVFWSQGRLDDAETWLRRYRDDALRLAAMERSNFAWQREVAYGNVNLGTLDIARGRNQQAEQIFLATNQLYQGWLRAHPHDTGLRDEAATVDSYLGTLAMEDGRLAEARVRFAEQVEYLSANRAAEPDNAQWKSEWPAARLFLVQAQIETGEVAAARRGAAEAAVLSEALTKQDPANKTWQLQLGMDYWWLARLDSRATPERAVNEAAKAKRVLAAVHAIEPKDSLALHWLAKCMVLLGEVAWRRGALDESSTWLSHAQAALASDMASQENTKAYRLLPAELRLLQGNVAEQRGDAQAAHTAWSAAERMLRASGSPPAFDSLELLTRVLLVEHRYAEAAPYIARLKHSGYVPLYPWHEASVASK
ncbi:MAG: toll/interleukin-1 receptor domain-containing protein [Gammaproteobacteria bacterium]|nr:TIR domain-containing protein [Gammaproteobacteria bacterium]MBU6510136.1 TIR domain-containing protein [Gammaproteobacteria bacterium]MDE1983948.1 toll/interleukin-1 receptor domain-containing protein [Gammaproteobacteria bacterium]MDE2459764.1 toll/interleukin-1 receptor domain-containing protein [Gammaproteobacteria bacterium]